MTLGGSVAVDARVTEEVAQVGFVYRCASCLHWDDAAARCSLGFPVPAAWSADDAANPLDAPHIVFCKYFELE